MKHKSYKKLFSLLAICFMGTVFAQKFDKKFSENFKVNKDVEVEINASNADINVTTWNKNEVKIEAFIEIEGISKEAADKYFKNWNFEALGNSRKVQIISKGNNAFNFKNDFVFFDDMNFDFKMPDIDLSKMETIVIPEMNFDFDFDNIFDDIDENMGKNGNYEFRFKDGDNNIEIKSKKEWETFKKSKKYKELKKRMKIDKEKLRNEIAKSKVEMKKSLAKAKIEIAKIDKEKIRKDFEKARVKLKKLKQNFNTQSNTIHINGKKVKIKKRIEIKVPKKATFNLNTRHCKVKLPNTVAFGNVKYGSFKANNLLGGKLTIDYSPVQINDLNTCNLFLNNVTDAKIASVTNTAISNNSSNVTIVKVNENVKLADKFGKIVIDGISSTFGNFELNLKQSNTTINFGDVPTSIIYKLNNSKLDNSSSFKFLNNYKISSNAKIENSTTKNRFHLTADFSTIIIK